MYRKHIVGAFSIERISQCLFYMANHIVEGGYINTEIAHTDFGPILQNSGWREKVRWKVNF